MLRLDQKCVTMVTVHRPQPGFFHQARQKDVLRILEFVGSEAIYGVQRIELSRASDARPSWLLTPGRGCAQAGALLFQQPLACSSFSEMWRMG